ncbi:MAG: glycosyltransferase family 9 protein, partial [Candidatus Margulisbacteria bacterium]|nr:glycosyltransferase family 9 protein [Candidatus Margulisiibacteriota bacterium]
MDFFYVTNNLKLPVDLSRPDRAILFNAPPLDAVITRQVPSDYLYFTTECNTNTIKHLCKLIYKQDMLVNAPAGAIRQIQSHPGFPRDIGYIKSKHKVFIPLEEKIKPLLGKKLLKVAIINGMGTGSGDSLVGIRALQVFYEKLKQFFSEVEIDLFQFHLEKNLQLYGKEDAVHMLYPLPGPLPKLLEYDACVDMGSFIAREEFNDRPMIDFYLQALSIDSDTVSAEDKRVVIKLDPYIEKDLDKSMQILKARGSKLLLFHPLASTDLRTMPQDKARLMLDKIINETNYIIVSTVNIQYRHERYIDLSALSKSLDHFISIISRMDAVITVDTVTYHISQSFNIPTLVLFTSIDPEYRIKYYPMVSGILLGDSGNRLLGQHKSSRKDDIEYAKK